MSAAVNLHEPGVHIEESTLDALAGLLAEIAGMAPSALRLSRRQDEICSFMAAEGLTDGESLIEALRQPGALLDRFIDLFSVNETYFFRSNEQFLRIRRELMPALKARAGHGRTLRFWSAGCASGEEAYSLAIMARQEAPDCEVKVLGTDISISSLAKAQRGVYGAWSFREVAPDALHPYIQSSGKIFRVGDAIKTCVGFEQHNLAAPIELYTEQRPGAFDLILLRNVLIYFTPDAIARASANMSDCLAEGGWLVTGPSDPHLRNDLLEPSVGRDGTIYRRLATPRTTTKAADAANATVPFPTFKPRQPPKPSRKPSRRASKPSQSSPKAAAAKTAGDASMSLAVALSERAKAGDYAGVVALTETATLDQRAAELRGESLANLGDLRAGDEVERLIALFPLSAPLRYLRALLLLSERRLVEAAAVCRELLYIEPDSAGARMLQGEIQLQSGDVQAARRSFRGALRTLGSATALDVILLPTDAARSELEALARERLRSAHDEDRATP